MKARRTHTTPETTAAIERLRTLAAEAQDHVLLADGPPNPDHKLLDLCAEALHHLVTAERAWRDRPTTDPN